MAFVDLIDHRCIDAGDGTGQSGAKDRVYDNSIFRKYRIFNHWYPVFFSNFHLCLHSFAVMVRISHRENFRLIPTERQDPGGSNPIPAVVSRSAYGKDPFRIMVLQEHVHDGKGGTFHQDRRRHVLMFYGMCVAAAHLNGSHQFLHDVSSSRMHQSDTAKRQKALLRCFHCAKKEKVLKCEASQSCLETAFQNKISAGQLRQSNITISTVCVQTHNG